MNTASGSTRMARSTLKPAGVRVGQAVSTSVRAPPAVLELEQHADRSQERQADRRRCRSSPAVRPGQHPQPSAITSSPASGKPSMSQPRWWCSSAQLRHLVHVDGDPAPVHRDDDSEAHHHLARGDHHHDQGEHLAVVVACMRENATSARLPAFSISSRQSRITSGLRRRQHAGGADAEDERREDDEPGDVHQLDDLIGARPRPRLPRLREPAPPRASTTARRRRRPAAGTTRPRTGPGTCVSSSSPICARRPKPGPTSGARCPAASRPGRRSRCRARRRSPRRTAGRTAAERAPRVAAARRPADVGDHEHVEHHHGARVDDDLRGGEELGAAGAGTARQRDRCPTSASTL